MTVALSSGTEERLAAVFPAAADRDQARSLLEKECAEDLPLWSDASGKGLERVRFAVLKLSGGSLESLVEALRLARADWRDALVAAGFADDPDAHLAWRPGQTASQLAAAAGAPGGAGAEARAVDVRWTFRKFLIHAAIGLATLAAVFVLAILSGPGSHPCCLVVLIPLSAWFASWRFPGGAPGASLAVAAFFFVCFPREAGPTARTLNTALSVVITGSMLVCELMAAVIRTAQLRKQAGETTSGA
jgi:hypothetical protein